MQGSGNGYKMSSPKVKDTNKLLDRIKEIAKRPDTYRYLLFVVFFYAVFYYGVRFMNAGNSYDQAMAFRPFCISMGLAVLTFMDVNEWLSIYSVIYLPVWYVLMHYGYERHIIPDTCEYQFVDVIRTGKLVALVWGIVLIAVVRDLIWGLIKKLKNIGAAANVENNANASAKEQGLKKASFIGSVIGYLKKQPGAMHKLSSFHLVLAGLWLVFVIWTLIFQRGYFYINFFFVGFTSFHYVMSGQEERKKVLWRAICDAAILSLVYIVYKSLMHRPYDTKRYMAYFANSNMAGMYFASMVAVLFYRVDEWWHLNCKKAVKVVMLTGYYIVLGFTICLALFNYTRTTIMGLGFAFVTAFVVQLLMAGKKKSSSKKNGESENSDVQKHNSSWITKRDEKKSMVVLRYGIVILVVAALFQLTYNIIRYVPAKINEPSYFDAEYNPEKKVMRGDPVDSPKYTSMAAYLRIAFGKWGILINFEDREETGETTVEVDTERDVTNGRVDIWKTYLGATNLTGHYPGHITLDSGYFVYHGHSTYIHILYQYGLVAGLLFAVITVLNYAYSVLLYLKRGAENKYLLLAVLFSSICLIGYVTEWMGHPAYIICSMMYTIMGMIVTEPEKISLKK